MHVLLCCFQLVHLRFVTPVFFFGVCVLFSSDSCEVCETCFVVLFSAGSLEVCDARFVGLI